MHVPTIHALLDQKTLLVGAGQYMPHYDFTGLMAAAGFDFLFIDAEHGNRSIESLQHCVTTANRYGVPVVIRAADRTQGSLEQVLDIGAQGVMMPTLETVEDAELLVGAARFAPRGTRGWSPLGPWAAYSQDPASHRNEFSDVFVAGLIETPLGHENLDDILGVPGIDAFMLGPGDLSVRLGVEVGDARVHEMVSASVEKIIGAGKVAWSVGDGDLAHKADQVEAGVRMIIAGSDAGLLWHLRGERGALEAELTARGLLP